MSRIRVLTANVLPELLITSLPLDRLTRQPLLSGNALQMAIAVLIESMIRDKTGRNDFAMLPRRDHGELLHVQVNGDCDQIRIALALHNFLRRDSFPLQEMNGRRVFTQDQFGAFLLPSRLPSTLLKVPVVTGRIVDPLPLLAGIDLEAEKALAQVQGIKFQRKRPGVERGMVGRRRDAWFPFPLARMLPGGKRGEIATGFANAIFDAPLVDTDSGSRETPD